MINIFVGKDFTPAMISEVTKDSPAQVAGLKKNDIISVSYTHLTLPTIYSV